MACADEVEIAGDEPLTGNVLGLFAPEATYRAGSEERLQKARLDPYPTNAPTVAEMTAAALRFLDASGKRFFLMVEEEDTDDFANRMNAPGPFEACRRTDAMIEVSREFITARDDTLLLAASDSDAPGLQTIAFGLVDAEGAPAKLPPDHRCGNSAGRD